MQKQVGQVGIKAQDICKARKLEREEIMAKGVKHYFKNGKEHKGATHKDAKGRVMSGKTHTASSKFLVHMKDLSDTAKKKAKSA
jgi:hypothetical protein